MSANRNSYMNEFKKQTVEEAKAENLAVLPTKQIGAQNGAKMDSKV